MSHIVYLKTLSGELFPLEISTNCTKKAFYEQVIDALPTEIKPQHSYHQHPYQLTILRTHDLDTMCEVCPTDDRLEPREDEIFSLLLEARVYDILLENRWIPVYLRTAPGDYSRVLYEQYTYTILRSRTNQSGDRIMGPCYREVFFYDSLNHQWFIQEDLIIEGGEENRNFGHFTGEVFYASRAPVQKGPFTTIHGLIEYIMGRLPRITPRIRDHLGLTLLSEWNKTPH